MEPYFVSVLGGDEDPNKVNEFKQAVESVLILDSIGSISIDYFLELPKSRILIAWDNYVSVRVKYFDSATSFCLSAISKHPLSEIFSLYQPISINTLLVESEYAMNKYPNTIKSTETVFIKFDSAFERIAKIKESIDCLAKLGIEHDY